MELLNQCEASGPWGDAQGDWLQIEVPASKIPRISPEFLEEEKRTLGSIPALSTPANRRFRATPQRISGHA
jgi:hypothetical protein